MTASMAMGAKAGRLLAYATSGDVSGDRHQVVGYGAVVFS
ncbi:MAG TPA: AmmeMemoRadiSam system protein B [Methanothrix sp.]|nr:AmmeMemoRadiSam system protein B [Methanothrix sp.]